MKKLIAVLLCTIHFSTFTWNWDFLKPNFSSWYQSWTNLSPNQQNMLIGASTGATLALLYAGWPVSQASAHEKALAEVDKRKKNVENYFERKKNNVESLDTVNQIVNKFEIAHFPYGSPFIRNRPEFKVYTRSKPLQGNNSNILTYYVAIGIKNRDNTPLLEIFYLPREKTWVNLN